MNLKYGFKKAYNALLFSWKIFKIICFNFSQNWPKFPTSTTFPQCLCPITPKGQILIFSNKFAHFQRFCPQIAFAPFEGIRSGEKYENFSIGRHARPSAAGGKRSWQKNLKKLFRLNLKIYEDREKAEAIDGIAFHWYSHGPFEQLTKIHELWPEKFILATEVI